ncbi:auxin efflux carrier component 5 [Andrographis paniculata]|uniref:auxin efflux carrier component 5 n=1 Tax=Andrographis paniculata TaxID=175694 RepID=UPI0021E8BF80|nr:auxin efflux carrier component 5 [Andrographis paniculata]
MIEWGDIYNVVVAIAPLYTALILGYAAVRWWRVFDPPQCEAINKMVCYFTYPLFVLEFAAHVDPFRMNFLFIAADVASKVIIAAVLALWAKFRGGGGGWCWFITGFSLSTLTNSLVVGVPLLRAMYGAAAVDLVVQSSVFQALVWLTILLFVLELRRTSGGGAAAAENGGDYDDDDENDSTAEDEEDCRSKSGGEDDPQKNPAAATAAGVRVSFWYLMKEVCVKMGKNPNSYACLFGILWAFLSNRWHFGMPSLMEGSILIMSRAATGTAMFSMGLFMALQEKVIACGASLTVVGLALKFILGPLAMAIASLAVGLHGDVLRVAIIQAALPQSITSFIFAKEYGLHADVLSTAVIFGMFVSLPVLVGYYAILEFVH